MKIIEFLIDLYHDYPVLVVVLIAILGGITFIYVPLNYSNMQGIITYLNGNYWIIWGG